MDWSEFDAAVGIFLHKPDLETVGSGVLISPSVVLTAAHCLDGLSGADVVAGEEMSAVARRLPVARWVIHPGYTGNHPGDSTDIGLLFLRVPMTSPYHYPSFALFRPGLPFERVGYGLRDGRNRRIHVDSSLNAPLAKHYVLLDDENGLPGDSGGPVFQREGEKLRLVGVHTGRKLGPGEELLAHSYVQLLYKAELDWIHEEMGKGPVT